MRTLQRCSARDVGPRPTECGDGISVSVSGVWLATEHYPPDQHFRAARQCTLRAGDLVEHHPTHPHRFGPASCS